MTLQEDLQEKVKIKVINMPFNMKGELVLDFKNSQSVTITMYPEFRVVNSEQGYQVKDVQVITEQQPAIPDVAGGSTDSDGVARTAINDILAMLRVHGIIAP